MPDFFYPELASGTYTQYPIRKTLVTRTVTNAMLDGRVIATSDPGASRIIWELSYVELSGDDCDLLRNFYNSCFGRLRSFTFIDPTDNMLRSSADFNAADWHVPDLIRVQMAGSGQDGIQPAYSFTNSGQESEEISQLVSVPTQFQYCFSIYVKSAVPGTIDLIRRGQRSQEISTSIIGPDWNRVVSTGSLSEEGTGVSIAIRLNPGQQVSLCGPQMEPQSSPSRYRATGRGGVYGDAHFASEGLAISADGPQSYSLRLAVEARA